MTNTIQWRVQWDYEADAIEREKSALDFSHDPGHTLQAPAEEADLNVIMKRFGLNDGSILPQWRDPRAIYGDFSQLPDDPVVVHETLRRGQLSFEALPASIRTRFRDGPTLYNWLQLEENWPEAVKLGLLHEEALPPAGIPDLVQRIDTLVSMSTSSDKESLVQPSTKKEK